MAAPKKIRELVERFERNRGAYRSGAYNEAQVRKEFIDPFFVALGWDMDNRHGLAEAYKDVIHEDAIKVGAAGILRCRISFDRGRHWQQGLSSAA